MLFDPEPEIVHFGVPPCLKCGLAPRATDAVALIANTSNTNRIDLCRMPCSPLKSTLICAVPAPPRPAPSRIRRDSYISPKRGIPARSCAAGIRAGASCVPARSSASPASPPGPHDASRRRCGCLDALSGMAERVARVSACPRPPRAASADAASPASSIVRFSSPWSSRSNHRTAVPGPTPGIFLHDQGGQGERLLKSDRAELARGRLSDHDVPALDRPLEDRPRVTLRCQRPFRWGRTETAYPDDLLSATGHTPPQPHWYEGAAHRPARLVISPPGWASPPSFFPAAERLPTSISRPMRTLPAEPPVA
jgi:hypothetical protein